MLKAFWNLLGRHTLCGAAFLTVANLVQAQGSLPTIPQPPNIPAVVADAPKAPPIVPVSAPETVPTGVPIKSAPTTSDADALKARIDRLEQQNQELMQALKGLQAVPTSRLTPLAPTETSEGGNTLNKSEVQKLIADHISQRERAAKEADAVKKLDQEAKGFTVGNNLGMSLKWNHGPWLETPDKAFRFHVGGRTQYDIVGVDATDNVQFGKGGIGAYNDGVNFRRARFTLEGTMWEVFDFTCEWDFINTTQAINSVDFKNGTTATNTFNTPVPTDLWIQMTHLPVIGNIRVGNQKPWIGFEHMTSSRFLNFLERSYQFDAFIEDGNNGFTTGISAFNTWGSDQNGMWGVGLYKNTRSIFGWNVGEGEWQGTGRATWLPVYRDNGRYLVHLGMGAQIRDLDNEQVRFRSRTLLRQAPAALHNIAAIGQTNGNSQLLLNPELVANIGSFTFQAEYNNSQVYGVDNIIRTPTQTNAKIAKQTYHSQGFYVEGLYFLTGEHRLYNKKNGGFDRVIPHRNYYFVHGEGNQRLFQSGAWQVGARYSYLDLNDGPIRGGQLNDVTLGLNWFLNPNVKIQWNYSYGYRTVDAISNGSFQGAGVRFAFDW